MKVMQRHGWVCAAVCCSLASAHVQIEFMEYRKRSKIGEASPGAECAVAMSSTGLLQQVADGLKTEIAWEDEAAYRKMGGSHEGHPTEESLLLRQKETTAKAGSETLQDEKAVEVKEPKQTLAHQARSIASSKVQAEADTKTDGIIGSLASTPLQPGMRVKVPHEQDERHGLASITRLRRNLHGALTLLLRRSEEVHVPILWLVVGISILSLAWFAVCFPNDRKQLPAPQEHASIQQLAPQTQVHQTNKAASAVAWAMGACVFFGVTHWYTEALQHRNVTAWIGTHIGRRSIIDLMCAMSGVGASLVNHILLLRKQSELPLQYKKMLDMLIDAESRDLPKMVSLLAVGPLHYAALSAQRAFLERSVANVGPLMAIVSTDMVPITIIMACCFGEFVPPLMMVGMLVILVSNGVIGLSVANLSGDPESVAFSVTSMCLFACAAICLRLTAQHGFSTTATFIVRCQMLAISAAIGSALSPCPGEASLLFIASGILLAVVHDAGIFCITASLSYPYAGPVAAIWGSNASVVFMLNWLVLHTLPELRLVLAMFCTIAGIWLCAMAGD